MKDGIVTEVVCELELDTVENALVRVSQTLEEEDVVEIGMKFGWETGVVMVLVADVTQVAIVKDETELIDGEMEEV